MKILLLVVGKTTESYFSEAIKEYSERLKHYITFDMEVIPDLKNMKNLSFDQQKEKGVKNILLCSLLLILNGKHM